MNRLSSLVKVLNDWAADSGLSSDFIKYSSVKEDMITRDKEE